MNNSAIPEADLIADLKRVYEETGNCSKRVYVRYGRFAYDTLRTRFGLWTDVVAAAGLTNAYFSMSRGRCRNRERIELAEAGARGHEGLLKPRERRTCLRCDKRFASLGPQNRICNWCKATRNWDVGMGAA